MKLIIATGTFSPEISGQATFVYNLVNGLKQKSIEPIIISYGKLPDRENIFFVRRNLYRHIKYWRKLKEHLNSKTIIYALDLISSGLPAALAKDKNKLVVRISGDFLWEKMVNSGKCEIPLRYYYEQPKGLREKFYLIIYRFVLAKCDKVIFNNNLQRDLYKKIFELTENKITLIPNPFPSDFKIKLGYKQVNKSNEIIYAGRFIPLKNIIRLITAFKQIKRDLNLVLIGDGPQKEEVIRLAKDDKRIKIEPEIPREKLFERISQSLMVAIPSLSDMNPNLALEAISLHRPVLLTKENGLSEEIKNYCQLVDPLSVDDIKAGIENILAKKAEEKIYRIENNYSLDDSLEKHLEIFNQL